MSARTPARLLALVLVLACALPSARAAIIVNSDSGARNIATHCTLRDAIVAVRTQFPAGGCPAGNFTETIALPVNATIVLTERDFNAQSAGLPAVPENIAITIQGNGSSIIRSGAVVCTRNGLVDSREFRLFEVESGAVLRLENLQLANGCADSALDDAHGRGGAIHNQGQLELRRVLIRDSRARHGGGAIYQGAGTASLRVFESELYQNYAGQGGAIRIDGGALTLERSLLRRNYVFDDSSAGYGGSALFSWRQVGDGAPRLIVNSTLTEHLQPSPAAVAVIEPGAGEQLAVVLSTLSANAGFALGGDPSASVVLANSIVAGHSLGNCRSGGAQRQHRGRNLFDDQSCVLAGSPDLHNIDPQLLPLADNGGPTMALVPALVSPAVDSGANCADPLFPAALLQVDQDGSARPQGLSCDIGAIELPASANFLFANSFEG
jgi:hypothetical protein